MLSAAVITVLMAMTLLAAGPIYADAVSLGSLQRTMAEASPAEANVAISLHRAPDNFVILDNVVTSEVERTFATTGHAMFRILEAEAYELETEAYEQAAGETDLINLAIFRSADGFEDFATLEAGVWPGGGGTEVEVAVHRGVADALELELGDRFTAVNRRDRSVGATATVVGIYSIDSITDPYWMEEPLIRTGIIESTNFRSFGPFITDQPTLLGELAVTQPKLEWRVFPDFATLTPSGISQLGADLAGLQDRLDGGLSDREAFVSALATVFTVDSQLGTILSDTARSLTVTRTGVLMLSAQLAILAAYALMLTAGLMVETRRTETVLLRSRGASNTQILATALAEGALITVPAALVAPWLASWALQAFSEFGPLAAANLDLAPQPSSTAYVIAFLAAAGATLALAIPSYRATRAFSDSNLTKRREDGKGRVQRLGIDLALVVLAAFAFWQLQAFGVSVTSRVQGLGVDPLLIAAPALGLLAGGTLALRTVPLISRFAERGAARRKAAVFALSAWQVSRRPRRYARSALLLVMAIAIGVFTASYAATWSKSQADQADFEIGADVRVSPDRRVNASIADLQLSFAHEQLDVVDESMPVVNQSAQLARSEGALGRFVMLDATRAPGMMNIREDLITTDFGILMESLAAERPSLGAVSLPGTPEALSVVIDVSQLELPDDVPSELAERNNFTPTLRVVLQDGDSLLHRVSMGAIPVDAGPVRLSTDLLHTDPNGEVFSPIYPLALVDIELFTVAPTEISREAEVVIHEVAVLDRESGNDWAPAAVQLEGSAWELSRFVNGRVRRAPSIRLGETLEDTGPLHIAIESGDTGFSMPVPVHYSIRVRGTDLPGSFPIVVTEGFLLATATEVGDNLNLDLAGARNDTARIIGTLVEFPTVEPERVETVVIDLATFQMMNYGVGSPIARPNEYWLGLNDANQSVTNELLEAPYASPDVTGRVERAQVLRADPIALGAVASLSLGFLAATVFAAVGFAVSATVSARERLTEFALLRALGLSNRQLRRWLIIEQGALVAMSLVLGTLVGLGLAMLILPLISITQGGAAAFPTPEVVLPIAAIVGLEASVVATLVLIVTVVALALRRLGLGSLLRIGED